jgi:hypothetical protein
MLTSAKQYVCAHSVRTLSSVDRRSDKGIKPSVPARHHLARTTPIPRNGPLLVSPDKRAATAKKSRHEVNEDNDDYGDNDSFENDVAAWRHDPAKDRERVAVQQQGIVIHYHTPYQ